VRYNIQSSFSILKKLVYFPIDRSAKTKLPLACG
jgi:hypothetical protein